MKLFKITASEAGIDEYASIVIIAETKERALDIAINSPQPYDWKDENIYDINFEFNEQQFPLIVEEIPMKQERVVSSEFING